MVLAGQLCFEERRRMLAKEEHSRKIKVFWAVNK